jgi:hypothetical protein
MHYGDIVWTWCSKHITRTDHIYKPYTPAGEAFRFYTCLECYPEAKEQPVAMEITETRKKK